MSRKEKKELNDCKRHMITAWIVQGLRGSLKIRSWKWDELISDGLLQMTTVLKHAAPQESGLIESAYLLAREDMMKFSESNPATQDYLLDEISKKWTKKSNLDLWPEVFSFLEGMQKNLNDDLRSKLGDFGGDRANA